MVAITVLESRSNIPKAVMCIGLACGDLIGLLNIAAAFLQRRSNFERHWMQTRRLSRHLARLLRLAGKIPYWTLRESA
jgi:hypothetical protein